MKCAGCQSLLLGFVTIRGHSWTPPIRNVRIDRLIAEYSEPARAEAPPPAHRCLNGGRGSARAACMVAYPSNTTPAYSPSQRDQPSITALLQVKVRSHWIGPNTSRWFREEEYHSQRLVTDVLAQYYGLIRFAARLLTRSGRQWLPSACSLMQRLPCRLGLRELRS